MLAKTRVENKSGTFIIKINGTKVATTDYYKTAEMITKDIKTGFFDAI